MQVIGAGLGRTGTHSLAQALETLGFGPCYHVHALARHEEHLDLWWQALAGRPIKWEAIFGEYQAAVEWPSVSFLPQLLERYPQAKIILTVRDSEQWYASASQTIFEGLELGRHNPDAERRKRGRLLRRLILEEMFANRPGDKTYALSVFEAHNQRVREIVPADRLLEFQVKAGWRPLCDFLDVPVPAEPFPRVNRRTEFLSAKPAWAKKLTASNKRDEHS